MADPLGIITSALHAAHKVYEVVKTIKDAPEEIQSLQDQVELLDSILPRINDFPHRAGESASISLLVAKAEELNSSLDKFLNKTTKMSQGKRKVKKLKWWFNADEAKSLTGKLSIFYGALSALHSIESSGHIHTRFSDLEESFTSTNEHLQGCFTEVHTHLDAQLVGVREIFQEELAKSSEELMHSLLASRVRELRTLANEQRRGESHGFDQNSVLYNTDYVEQVADVLPVSQDQADGSSTSARLDHTSSTVAAAAVYYPPPSLSSLETPCKHCGCQCHGAQSLWRTPESLASIIGHHYLKIPFPRRLWPGLVQCDVPTCKKGWLIQVRSFLPYWFARVEMQMRFEMLPVHFCIQTPRVNTDIKWHLGRMVLERGADVFKELLRSRRVTINDVDENGYSLLHRAVTSIDHAEVDSLVNNVIDAASYLLEVGVPLEWQNANGRTFTEVALDLILYHVNERATRLRLLEQVKVRLVGPSFQDDLDRIATRLGLTKLHQRMYLPGPQLTSEALKDLTSLLDSPDRLHWMPLYYAIRYAPYAVEMLLNAGADLQLVNYPLHLAIAYSDSTVIGPLIRAGAGVNERNDGGSTPLIDVMRWKFIKERYQKLSELFRHAGNKIDWDVRDNDGKTALDYALEEQRPTQLVRLLKLFSRRDILEHDRKSVIQVGGWEWTYGDDGCGCLYRCHRCGAECECPLCAVERSPIRDEDEELAMPGSFKQL